MKSIIAIILICFYYSSNTFAQTSGISTKEQNDYVRFAKQKSYGNSEWTCIYRHEAKDPVLNQTETSLCILQLNDSASLYQDYGQYQRDSALLNRDRDKITRKEAIKIYSTFYSKSGFFLLKNKETNQLTYNERIFTDRYYYYEPIPDIQWVLSTDTMTIRNLLCRKASATFRGREWTVWYTEEIPYHDGPWKFGGLPGLILQAESKDGEHFISAYIIKEKGTPILHDLFTSAFRTNRERFNKEKKNYKTDVGRYIQSSHLVETDAPIQTRRMFYSPIEKE